MSENAPWPPPSRKSVALPVRAWPAPAQLTAVALWTDFAKVVGSAITDVTFFTPKAVARERGLVETTPVWEGRMSTSPSALHPAAAPVATRVRWNIFLLMLMLVSINYFIDSLELIICAGFM